MLPDIARDPGGSATLVVNGPLPGVALNDLDARDIDTFPSCH